MEKSTLKPIKSFEEEKIDTLELILYLEKLPEWEKVKIYYIAKGFVLALEI